jgi:hypothetical protein
MTARTPSGASVTPALRTRARVSETMPATVLQATVPSSHPSRRRALKLLSTIATLGLCAFQFGDQNGLNNMPFEQVPPLVSDLAKARRLAKQGNIDLLVGQMVPGKAASLRGEITDANCYLGSHAHGYDHAFCAKMCAAAGNPLLFVSDQGGEIYLVLSERNGTRLRENVLDRIGVPGTVVKGKVLDAGGMRALAIEGLAP